MFIEQKYLINSIVQIQKSTLSVQEKIFEIDNILFAISKTSWYRVGGNTFFNEYNEDYEAMLRDISFLESFPLYIKSDIYDEQKRNCVITHSCFIPLLNKDSKLKELNNFKEDILWNKYKYSSISNNKLKFFNIFGHTPVDSFFPDTKKKPSVYIDKKIGLANVDTGACYDKDKRGFLSGIFFPSLKTVSVKSKF